MSGRWGAEMQPIVQVSDHLPTSEAVSGVRAVQIGPSGALRIAMAGVSGRMPAIGISLGNALSGQGLTYVQYGSFQAWSGLLGLAPGRVVWVGRSGHLAHLSGSWLSGGLTSGCLWQRVGVAVNSGGLRVHVDLAVFSGVGGVGILPI